MIKKKGGERNMAFCKNCGTQLKDGDLFCQTCGQKNEVSSTPNLNVNQQEPKSDDLLEKGMTPDSGEGFTANEMQQPKMNGDFVANEMQPKTNGDFGANQMKPDSDEVFVIDKKENSGKKIKRKEKLREKNSSWISFSGSGSGSIVGGIPDIKKHE